ncbi:MAG: methionine--tRNA ligase [Patescibacteria group bacterium]
MDKKFYITTPIYYANGLAHVGHFLTTTAADVLARYQRLLLGDENVFFTTGLDEHGTTVEQAAVKDGFTSNTIKDYTDKRAEQWKQDFDLTNISYDYFVRTTNPKHEKIAQDFIREMVKNGDVYKAKYKGKYCNGCEKFLTLSDLNKEGYCPLHRPDQVIEIEEENYFFKLSKYAGQVKKLIEDNTIKIIPENKKAEIISRLSGKVEDFSISRPKEKVSWGVEFPDDPRQVIYVWIEALINYRSSLEITKKPEDFWSNSWHLLGKDINWFHNTIWPAMLLAAGYSVFSGSFVHGFLMIGGEKISKSKGNIITPKQLVEKFGVDGARYLILANFPYDNDSDVTWEQLIIKYNADLANGLGNLVSRVAKLAENSGFEFPKIQPSGSHPEGEVKKHLEEFRFDKALEYIWGKISEADKYLDDKKPWNLQGVTLQEVLQELVGRIRQIANNLRPFLPETAEKVEKQFAGGKIASSSPLFPRLQ